MAWLGEGLSSLRGQITNVANFTKDVLSDGRDDDLSDISGLGAAQRNIRELEEACAAKDLEISNLRRQNELLQGSGGPQNITQAVSEHGRLEYLPTDSWHQHAPSTSASLAPGEASKSFVLVPEENEVSLMSRIDHLEAENKLMRKTCFEYEEQVAELLERQVKSASTTSEDSAQLDKFSVDLQHASLMQESSQEDIYKLQLQAAECRVMELEVELQHVHQQLLNQLGDTETSTSVVREEVEQTRHRLMDEPEAKAQALRARQVAANTMYELTQKRSRLESSLQKLRNEQKHISLDINTIIQRLGDSEQQEFIHGALNALELENQVLKMRNAELEIASGNSTGIDMDVGYKRNHFNGEDEMTDDSPIALAKQDTPDRLAEAEREALIFEELTAAKQCLTLELESMATLVQDLEAKTANLQEENSTLTTSLEELDQQNQLVIDQLLETKKAVQKENSSLQIEVAEMKQKLEHAHKTDVKSIASVEVGTETSDLECNLKEQIATNDSLCEEYRKTFEDECYANILKLITFDLSKEYYNKDKYDLNSISLVKEVLKMYEEGKWKKETLERKVPELMKKAQDAEKSLAERDEMVIRLENESAMLKSNVEALVEQLMEAKNGGGEGLAIIPENSEEVVELEQQVAFLESQLNDVRKEKELLLEEFELVKVESLSSANKCVEVQEMQVALQQALKAKSELEQVNETLKVSVNAENVVEDLQRECSRLQELLNKNAEQLNEMLDSKNVLESKCSKLEDALNVAKNNLNAADIRSKEEIADMKAKLEVEIEDYKKRCEEMTKNKGDMEKKFSEGVEKSTEVNRLLDESIQSEANAVEKCANLEELLKSQEKHANELEIEVERLNVCLCKNQNFEHEYHQLKEKLSATEQEIVNVNETVYALEQKLNDAVVAKTGLEIECERLLTLETTLGDQSAMTHDVEKWKMMAKTTERQLDEALRARAELEDECARLFSIETKVHNQEHLVREVAQLTEISKTTELRLSESLEAKELLEKNLDQLKACLEDQKNLEQEAREWRQANASTEHQLQEALANVAKLTQELTKLKNVESECAQVKGMVEVLQFKLNNTSSLNNELKTKLEATQTQAQRLLRVDEEIIEWKEKVRVTQGQLNEALSRKLELEKETQRMEDIIKNMGMEKTDQEKPHADDSNASRQENLVGDRDSFMSRAMEEKLESIQIEQNKILSTLDEKMQEISALKSENNRLMQVISEEKAVSIRQEEEKYAIFTLQEFQTSETSHMAKETIANLSKIIKDKDIEMEALVQKCETLVSLLQESNSNKSTDTLEAERDTLLKELSRIGGERDELIQTVQIKHQESLQYHGEIQRLSAVLNQELLKTEQIRLQHSGLIQQCEDKQKMLINTQNELITVKQRLDNLEQLARKNSSSETKQDPDSVSAQDEVIRMKTLLAKELGLELKTREKEIELLKLEIDELRSDKCQAEGGTSQQNPNESRERRGTLVQELQAERARLVDSLQQETTRNKYLQNEVQEQHEKESSLLRELERLRLHLVNVEDTFTMETLTMEEQMKELQSKLTQAEDRIKNCSTAYTSANIRANQHVESLQGQARLIGQQRDDIQTKLMNAEDQVQRHAAALTNLQGVLEQFQRDKESDIASATSKLRKQLHISEGHYSELTAEVASLQVQLAEAKEGLSAAARLTEQLDKKTETITTLKEEVQRLNDQLNSAETREKSATESSEGKVDRYLVKNLLIGYLVAPPHTKSQALRIIATVLDFNHDERSRVGLEPGAQPASWFKSLMHPATGPNSNQSLAEAFVRFLESESRPQPQLRLLPSIQDAPQRENSMEPSISGTRSPLLLSEVQLPTFTQFPVARNSSSILKDVLKDS